MRRQEPPAQVNAIENQWAFVAISMLSSDFVIIQASAEMKEEGVYYGIDAPDFWDRDQIPDAPGLYQWKGTVKMNIFSQDEDGNLDFDMECEGDFKSVTTKELFEFIKDSK